MNDIRVGELSKVSSINGDTYYCKGKFYKGFVFAADMRFRLINILVGNPYVQVLRVKENVSSRNILSDTLVID